MTRGPAAVLLIAALGGCGQEAAPLAERAEAPAVTSTTLSGASPYASCGRGDPSVQADAEVEPHVAVSPADPRHLVAAWQQDRRTTGGAVGIAVSESGDGGVTWQTRLLPGGAPCGARGLTGASDPWLSIGPDGTAYLAELRFAAVAGRRPARAGVAVHRAAPGIAGSEDAWSAPVEVTAARRFDDKPAVTADPRRAGVAYVAWHRGPRTLLSITRDGGRTWSAPRRVASMPASVGHVISALPDGRLVMTALALGGRPAFVAAASGDGGRTWGRRVAFGAPGRGVRSRPRLRVGEFPAVAVRPDGGIVALWSHGRAIERAASRDGGRTWSRPRVVLRRPGRVVTPAAAAAADGTIGLSWTETAGPRGVVVFASSRDAGRTWRARRLIGPFDLRRAPRAGRARFLGDYTGLVAVPGGFGVLVSVAPPSARRGRSDVVFARVLVP